MGTVTFQAPAEMNYPSIWYGDLYYYDNNYIVLWEGYGGRGGIYIGNFRFNQSGVSGGTLTGYLQATNVTSLDNYTEEYSATGFSASAKTAYNLIQSGNAEGFQSWVLSKNDTINGSAYSDYIKGYAGNDLIYGNNGSDTLDGGSGNDTLNGGAGADVMYGGVGNDTYIVDDEDDTVIEDSPNGGRDSIQSSVSFSLGSYLENLTLTGSEDINGTGNDLANTITGNSGDNILEGGAGKDKLIGGLGDDTYIVNLTSKGALEDTLTEGANAGDDTVILEGDYTGSKAATIKLANNFENLDIRETSGLLNLTGNNSNNELTGNDSRNTLSGGNGDDVLRGGLGNDTLTGGAGADHFVFDTELNSMTNVDIITDFAPGTDKIDLSSILMDALGDPGTLSMDTFLAGDGVTQAQNANQQIIYNKTSGALYYDADGSGTEYDAVQVAVIGTTTHPLLTYQDFNIT